MPGSLGTKVGAQKLKNHRRKMEEVVVVVMVVMVVVVMGEEEGEEKDKVNEPPHKEQTLHQA